MDRVGKHGPSARERLLATASRLFYKDGIRAVGVNTIAAEAQVTKATLYAHFGSKDGLITEHLRTRDQRWRADLERFLADHEDDPVGQLDAIFGAYRAWTVADAFRGCGFVNAAAELADPGHPARAVIDDHKHAIRTRLEDLATAAGCPDPYDTAEQWFLLLEGGMVTAALRRDPEPLLHARHMATRLLPSRVEDGTDWPGSPERGSCRPGPS